MLIPDDIKIYIATTPIDMRKSYDGLSGIINNSFNQDVYQGALYVFFNKRRDSIKILWYEKKASYAAFSIWMRRLDKGTFKAIGSRDDILCEATVAELALIVEDIKSGRCIK